MTEVISFDDFLDDMLLEVAARQSGSAIKPVSLSDVYVARGKEDPMTYLDSLGPELQQRGYGNFITYEGRLFEINGAGLAQVGKIRAARKPPTFVDQMASDKVQRIGSLIFSAVSLIVSIAALIVAYLAYSKA